MSKSDAMIADIETLGFRESPLFQAGWSTGRIDLVTRLGEAKSEEEMLDVLRSAREESRQIALDGIKAALGLGDTE